MQQAVCETLQICRPFDVRLHTQHDAMTETEMKLRDAATQMKLAVEHMANDETVRSCVNSYISLARSVTFVMQRESAEYPELKAWYEDRMSSLKELPILRFFNASRVYSIHKGVVAPIAHTAPIHDLKIDGVLQPPGGTMTFLRFDGIEKFIPGSSGGVFRLCEEYFLLLKSLVGEWLAKRNALGIK